MGSAGGSSMACSGERCRCSRPGAVPVCFRQATLVCFAVVLCVMRRVGVAVWATHRDRLFDSSGRGVAKRGSLGSGPRTFENCGGRSPRNLNIS